MKPIYTLIGRILQTETEVSKLKKDLFAVCTLLLRPEEAALL
jgi:hypothetical protein